VKEKKVNVSITQKNTKSNSSTGEYTTFSRILEKIKSGELKVNKSTGQNKSNVNDYLRINKKVPTYKFLRELAEGYIKYSKAKEEKTISYIDTLIFYNKIGFRYYRASYTLKEAYEREYSYVVSVCDYINKLAIQEGYVPVFLTLTLPSKYHPTTTVNGKRQYNPNFNFNVLNFAKVGYRKLQEIFRLIHRRLTSRNTKKDVRMYYFKVVEMHKDFTPHMHIILFFKREYLLNKFFHLMDIVAELVADGELGEQFDARILNEEDKATAYVQKYLRKAYLSEGQDENYLYLLDGWRKQNRIRMFTHSNTYLNKADFVKILGDFIENEEDKIRKADDEYINRYAEISQRTQYFEAKNYELTHEGVDATIIDYLNRGGDAIYWIFEERWAVDGQEGMSELYAKTITKKSKEILNLLQESDGDTFKYLSRISDKVKSFVKERERELKLIEKTINDNNTLKAKIGIKQFENAKRNYLNKLNAIKSYYEKLEAEVDEVEKISRELMYSVVGTYNFRDNNDMKQFKEELAKHIKLKDVLKEKEQYLQGQMKKMKKTIKRILEAIQEKLIYLIETKYITTKKIIFKAHYKNGEFYYHEKIYDKAYVEVVKAFDEDIREELLSLSV
jgi:hypothetical protein